MSAVSRLFRAHCGIGSDLSAISLWLRFAISLIDLGRFWVLATHLTYGADTMTVVLPARLLTPRTDTVSVVLA